MKRSVDVPALVTGLILLGFGAVGAWLLTGRALMGPPSMWFASVLMLAGVIGLVVSLGTAKK